MDCFQTLLQYLLKTYVNVIILFLLKLSEKQICFQEEKNVNRDGNVFVPPSFTYISLLAWDSEKR